ncbi:MAG: hypothetical protein AB2A00_19275 [Myxococcota bacterium]
MRSPRHAHALLLVPLLACPSTSGTTTPPTTTPVDCSVLDEVWSVDDLPPATVSDCQAPTPRDLSAESKLAVAVYHFNIQYVAGGLAGFLDDTERYRLNEVETEDRIVRQGLEPVLDMFLAHETFRADIELQAYFLEVMALRHPDVLDKLRTLALRGQIDVDSFHYSDQLYVAYGRKDQEVSLELTRQIFERTCIPVGRAIFTQEGQFCRGQIPLAQERGYAVSILPKNLFKYQVGEAAMNEAVLYEDTEQPGHPVILGGQSWTAPDQGFELRWLFMDDGEIAFTESGLNPYFGHDYVVDPAKINEHVNLLLQMEQQGYVFATVAEAAEAMVARGITPRPLPPILDGTWQPKDTLNVGRWMGMAGLWRAQENDSGVLSSIWSARKLVERAERSAGVTPAVTAAWRELLLAQVSDSTGWNPFINEVGYSLDHASRAAGLAETILACSANKVSEAPSPLTCESSSDKTLADLGITVVVPARAVQQELRKCSIHGRGGRAYELVLRAEKLSSFEPQLDPTTEATAERELDVHVTLQGNTFQLVQALENELRTVNLDDYVFDTIGIPLPMGLMSVGDRRWIIQDMASGRLAATLSRTGDGVGKVLFNDRTVTRAAASARRYILLEDVDAADALKVARAINVDEPLP